MFRKEKEEKAQENLQKIAQNLKGVSFSDGVELKKAVNEVSSSQGLFSRIKRFIFRKLPDLKDQTLNVGPRLYKEKPGNNSGKSGQSAD